jgi:Fic family protein
VIRSDAIPVPDLSAPAAHPEPTVPAIHPPERKQIYLGVTAPTRNSEEAENFSEKSAIHLAAYVMWRVNWVHPFDDGNGRTARAASYLVLCVKLGYRLPGKKSLIDLIVGSKPPYWAALEAADAAWADNNRIDVGELERLLENLLGAQLVSVLEDAKGQPIA